MKTPINNISSRRHNITMLLVVGILIVGFVVWSITSLKGRVSTTQPNLAEIESQRQKHTITEMPNQDTSTTNHSNTDTQEIKTEGLDSEERNENTTGTTTNSKSSQILIPLCFVKLALSCVLDGDDPLFASLGGVSIEKGLLVGGSLIRPNKIIYKTSFDTYTDEQLKDAAGKVLLSTQKTYNEKTKTLTIIVGVDRGYYQNLDTKGQRSFPLSQLVRSFLSMMEDSPDNYIKVEQVVGRLKDWQPQQK